MVQQVAGYTWTDVVEVEQVAQTPAGEVTIPMKMVYSGADPRLELLQTVPGTDMDASQIPGFTTSVTGPMTWNPISPR